MAYGMSRREVMTGVGASGLALSGAGFTQRQVIARGFVFEDRRGDGLRRPGDPGVPDVMVSNGRDVAITAQDGSWRLPAAPGDSLFVIKPPQWTTPMGRGGIPIFSYLHQPEGSPKSLGTPFPLIGPTGSLPVSLDFPLIRQDERLDFEALLMTDTQPDSAAELDYVRDDIVAAMLGRPAVFGINHGDVVSDDLSLYPRYLEILGATGIPWHHCPGNHDINYDAYDNRFARETWKRTFGIRHYAFHYAEAIFMVLDNVEYLGRGSGGYRGRIGPEQLAFVRNVLRHVPVDRLVVLCMHIPLRCYLDPDNPADTTADYRDLLRLLADRPHCVSFAGHLHATEHHYISRADDPDGTHPHHHHVLTAASGSWWSGYCDHRGIPTADSCDGTPNGFHVLSVQGNRYATQFIPAIADSASQLRIVIDGPHCPRAGEPASRRGQARLGLTIPVDALASSEVVVNVFDGGPKTSVSFEIIGHTSKVCMGASATPDPLILELFRGDVPRKAWVQAVTSSHIWRARLPNSLAPGAYPLVVRARDEYAREYVQRAVLQVTPRRPPSSA